MSELRIGSRRAHDTPSPRPPNASVGRWPSAAEPYNPDPRDEVVKAFPPSSEAAFHSILYQEAAAAAREPPREIPDYFRDLNLDQIVEAVVAHKSDYDLKPFFFDALSVRLETSRVI